MAETCEEAATEPPLPSEESLEEKAAEEAETSVDSETERLEDEQPTTPESEEVLEVSEAEEEPKGEVEEIGEVLIENPGFEVKSFLDIEAARVEELKLPVGFGYTEEKLPKRNLFSAGGVSITSLGQTLYNFKVLREEGIGKRKIHLKSRECRIGFEGVIYDNGTIGMTKLTSYSVCKDLPFKRALEVYTFMQKVVAGNDIRIEGDSLDVTITLPQRFEYLKLLKIVDTLYKYYSVSKVMNLNTNERVEFILKNAVKVNKLALLMRGLPVETMVRVEGEEIEKLSQADPLKIIKRGSIKLKKVEISFVQEVVIPEFVLDSKADGGKMSTSWKKATLCYKKVLD
ncbi:hypothetical protein PM10SUCC1_05380 [Propionigenium maris DSM 9537]|uniref:Uncharacterized protein n=1 Tax=Propionigenium maris DSM 9537 TaxID=1123000 RepID=A0A9W6LM34_9FUSO|nr:hypothetical protein [Propionigenium maris]GLI55023.1 hypothetical protein PM10SUCC1_05380 [Propionigenium maris DSM 9537]